MIKSTYVKVTTNGDGDGTTTGTANLFGKLHSLLYVPGTIDTGATVTVTCEGPASKPLLTKASAGTANTFYYPRDLVHAVADGAALTGTAGGDRAMPIVDGKVKVVIASGGDTATGGVVVYWEA